MNHRRYVTTTLRLDGENNISKNLIKVCTDIINDILDSCERQNVYELF